MSERPLVIYHANCWDGFCAAWVARKALGDIEAVPAQYGTEPPDVRGRQVFILDFSYPRDVLTRIVGEAAWTCVLDHHKTAEQGLRKLDEILAPDLTVVFDMEKSGGRIAWEYFWDWRFSKLSADARPFSLGVRRDRAPWLVDYTEDRDLWRHALEGTEEINAALRSHPLDFDLWDQFEEKDPRSTFYYEGAAIRRRERQIVLDHVRNARRENFDGTWTVPVVNATTLFSEIAGELAKGEPFAACYFDRQDGKRQWSLRSAPDGVDVSEIAKAHGGGGHKHAAGFEQAI
jgi:oligoribonuclease NrnB/cAMP/cGMP phosphodiesterase (DHH superfamily)